MRNFYFGCLLGLVAAMLATFDVSAQDTKALKREINDIKRSGKYIYAEAQADTEEKAKEGANVFLSQNINQYLEDNGLTATGKATSTNIKDLHYKIVPRTSGFRAFAYVPVATYNPDFGKTSAPEVKETKQDISYTGSLTTMANQGLLFGTEGKDKIKVRDLIGVYSVALGELMDCGDIRSAAKHLARLSSENIVKRFGTMRECPNTARSFWIIAKDSPSMEIVTILSPGSDGRTNYANGREDDTLANYRGYNAVWFQF